MNLGGSIIRRGPPRVEVPRTVLGTTDYGAVAAKTLELAGQALDAQMLILGELQKIRELLEKAAKGDQ